MRRVMRNEGEQQLNAKREDRSNEKKRGLPKMLLDAAQLACSKLIYRLV
jgi:hypothetical protein